MADTIPMYGRMIHSQDSRGALTETAQPYDVHGQFQRAIDRANLNKTFLSELEKLPNVKVLFHHKLTGADFRLHKAWFERRLPSDGDKRPGEIEVDFDVIFGCDGAHSSVRYHMMKYARMNYEQTYIDTLWCEFNIPAVSSTHTISTTPSARDGFATSPNHLHIWPGRDSMFIAIPSTDSSFTCTLFAPAATFAKLEQRPHDIEPFFQAHFPGAADLIGPGSITEQFTKAPHLPLISIKCSPHHYTSTGIILGDAAHAMVPFYGQGMNAGLEDVRVLFQHLDRHAFTPSGRAAALDAYNAERVADAHAINDLAYGNYWEMHAGVQSTPYLVRKKLEEFLSDKLPALGFATQYRRVSFTNQRYSEVVEAVASQRKVLVSGLWSSVAVAGIAWAVWLSRPGGLFARNRINVFSELRGVAHNIADTLRGILR